MTTAELRKMLSRFPKAPLALNPTPLHPLKRMQAELGCGPLFIKRDDLNGVGIGGNKIRNLEYLLGHALKEGKDTELVDEVLMKVIEKIEVPSEKEKRGRRSHEER